MLANVSHGGNGKSASALHQNRLQIGSQQRHGHEIATQVHRSEVNDLGKSDRGGFAKVFVQSVQLTVSLVFAFQGMVFDATTFQLNLETKSNLENELMTRLFNYFDRDEFVFLSLVLSPVNGSESTVTDRDQIDKTVL